ncbi:hypothetical protein Ahy_B05g075779 [Arachis hypogaea]|uniref:glucan endo-1,3-beta-D-glucosidase n=1 Tax=Arachis hypogaea TaxID=3818 RepID=A0A444Z212_ARAHY|nr:hypothetical protein Ahy_B05g075779 [Arachis hypogaea]
MIYNKHFNGGATTSNPTYQTQITGIQVSNKVYTYENSTMFQYLVPAVINIQNALSQLGISSNIQVSSPSSLAVLQESYHPSVVAFAYAKLGFNMVKTGFQKGGGLQKGTVMKQEK